MHSTPPAHVREICHHRSLPLAQIIKDFPKYYDSILDKAMARLDAIVTANGTSLEYRMQQIAMKKEMSSQVRALVARLLVWGNNPLASI